MENKQMDMGAELKRGWQLFQANMSLLVIAGLIAMVLSIVTCGILSGPLQAGLFMILARLISNDPQKPQPGDVFKGFDFFVQTLLLLVIMIVISLLLALIPIVGQLASFVTSSVMMWALLFIVNQKLTAIDALKRIFGDLGRGEFIMPLLYGAIVCLISGLGVLACGIGLIFTVPLAYAMMASAYQTLYGSQDGNGNEPDAEIIEPEVVPPSVDATL